MEYTYEIKEYEDGTTAIYRVDDCAWIPKDETNADYQAYLKSLEGNN